FKLEAGCYLEVSENESNKVQYFDLLGKINKTNSVIDYKEAKDKLRDMLFESVKCRMVSDVPLGAFLSGGIDSSIISAIMSKVSSNPINTFSIGFREKEYDESERAELVAKHIKSKHHLYYVDHNDLLEVVDKTLTYFDEPFGDSSAIPSMLVSKKAGEKVKVVLTGD